MTTAPPSTTVPLVVTTADILERRPTAQEALARAALPAAFQRLDPGPYGLTGGTIFLLETLEAALARLVAIRGAIVGRIQDDRRSGFAGGMVTPDEERGAGAVAAVIALDEATRCLSGAPERLPPEGKTLDAASFATMLDHGAPLLAAELAEDLARFVGFYGSHPDERVRPSTDEELLVCVASWTCLVSRTMATIADDHEHAPLLAALRQAGLEVEGVTYRGLVREAPTVIEEERTLMPVGPDDIVGNAEVLRAGLALAEAVAGFDLTLGQNPRTIKNPVLFVLGQPGCGKTVSAHAIGNHFLDLCARHGIPARFRIIRRTDWASHYQNKSANELIRIFREEIFDFTGVAGVYWPDIDTAFAARSDPGIRAEEKAVLGTLFGILDGTVGPRNGKWFLIADANYLTMDSAALSRLTQDPHYAKGPVTSGDFVTLLRDKKLARFREHLSLDEASWAAFGDRCVAEGLSGRAVDNMANKIMALIEDVAVPDEYYDLSFEDKQTLVRSLRRSLGGEELMALVERYLTFERDAEAKARQERFDARVDEIREGLAARIAAVGGAGESSP